MNTESQIAPAAAFRRGALIVFLTGALTIVVFTVMTAYAGGSPRPHTYPNKAGFTSAMIWLELIQDGPEARQVLGPATSVEGQKIRRQLDRANRIDFGFMIAYSLFNAGLFIFVYLGNRLTAGSPFRAAWFANLGLLLSLLMLLADGVETWRLYAVTAALDPGTLGDVTTLFVATRIKWAALFVSCLLLGAGTSAYFGFRPGILIGLVYCMAAVFGLAGTFSIELRRAVELGMSLMSLGWLCTFVHASIVWFRKPREVT